MELEGSLTSSGNSHTTHHRRTTKSERTNKIRSSHDSLNLPIFFNFKILIKNYKIKRNNKIIFIFLIAITSEKKSDIKNKAGVEYKTITNVKFKII